MSTQQDQGIPYEVSEPEEMALGSVWHIVPEDHAEILLYRCDDMNCIECRGGNVPVMVVMRFPAGQGQPANLIRLAPVGR